MHAKNSRLTIPATEKEDDIVRRDSLHAIINALPDPNYATLRAMTLHLYRVMDNSHVNRMNSHNLAVIFGPTLMGSDPSTAIADAGWQIKVIDTILQNTYQIFDGDQICSRHIATILASSHDPRAANAGLPWMACRCVRVAFRSPSVL